MFGKALRYGALHVDVNAHREVLAQRTPWSAQSVFLWLIVSPTCQRRDLRAIVCCSVLRARILPSFSFRTHASITLHAYFRGERTRAICARTRRSFGRILGAILKIYVHIELMGLISPGKPLRIHPRCVLLRYDLCTGRPRSRELFLTTYIIYIRKRAKRTVRRLIINFQSTAWYNIHLLMTWFLTILE